LERVDPAICSRSWTISLTTIPTPHSGENEIEVKVSRLDTRPKLYRPGRAAGTREMIVRPNYIVIYAEVGRAVVILRVLHAT
jgi:plasmid stabilization system protein ParE